MTDWNRHHGAKKAARTRRANNMRRLIAMLDTNGDGPTAEQPTIINGEPQYNTPPRLGGDPFARETIARKADKGKE